MKEAFLQFIWQFQLFNKQNLRLTSGEEINIIKPGFLNDQSGPDFSNAQINYDDLSFYGPVEIHLKSSEWFDHKHDKDDAYNNVILHVVLENDREVKDKDGKPYPCLVLKGRIPLNFYQNYEKLIASRDPIPCSGQLEKVNQVILISMLDRVLTERLEEKSALIDTILKETENDWEEVVFRVIVKAFGFKRNNEGFNDLGARLSFKSIKRHSKNLADIEAILFGIGGFLKGVRVKNHYIDELKERYSNFNIKKTVDAEIQPVVWKFFRLRPANFPTLRIAQLSAFLNKKEHLLSHILVLENLSDCKKLFKAEVSDYWKSHYRFSDEKVKGFSEIGESSIESLIINAIIPIWVSYGKQRSREDLIERSLRILEELSPENNKITRFWKDYGFPNNNAFDSQALIQLHNKYCIKRACLNCNVGVTLVREF